MREFHPMIFSDWLPLVETMTEHERSELLLALLSGEEPTDVPLWPFFKQQLEKQRQHLLEKSEKAKQSAKKRWGECERTQKDANACNGMRTHANDANECLTEPNHTVSNLINKKEIDKEKPHPSPSAQDASVSTPPAKKAKRTSVCKPADVPENLWCDWIALRKQKRLPLTAQALALVQAEATKAGKTLAEVLQICLQNSWAGFRANWLTDATNNQQSERPFYTPVHDWEEERKEHVAHAEALMRAALGGKA